MFVCARLLTRRTVADSTSCCAVHSVHVCEAGYDVCPGTPGGFLQMRPAHVSEDSASCACRVAGPQSSGFSVR